MSLRHTCDADDAGEEVPDNVQLAVAGGRHKGGDPCGGKGGGAACFWVSARHDPGCKKNSKLGGKQKMEKHHIIFEFERIIIWIENQTQFCN